MNAPAPANGAPRPSLFPLLAARARHATHGRLVADAAIGTTLLAVILLVRPVIWVLAMPAAVVSAYGVWGIIDRKLMGRAGGASRTTLVVARAVALGIGVAAAAAFALGALGVALGGWTF